MQIDSVVFGKIEIDETRVVRLTEPMPGFPKLSSFVVLDPDPESPFKWFQSLEQSNICFLIADPRSFFPEYTVELPASRLPDLELAEGGEAAVAVVLTVPQDPSKTTANLLAPLVFNGSKGIARQVILEGSGYSVRAPIAGPGHLALEVA
ncbi:MAG: flagellar assembly protein FliW [Deltaproteobacteria bacterium]|nr:flagellar assembly protein FliW [Deltaproteobacteria bacterium]